MVSDSLLDDEVSDETERIVFGEASIGESKVDLVERDGCLRERREIALFLDLIDLFFFDVVVVIVHAGRLLESSEKIDEGRDSFGSMREPLTLTLQTAESAEQEIPSPESRSG